jgi:hypothetical protein
MQDSDKKQFWLMINVAMELTNHPPLSKEAIVIWYERLRGYDFDVVSSAVDVWLKESSKPPTPKDIADLCKPKVAIHAKLPSPLAKESNRQHAKELIQTVENLTQPSTDYKAWARRIIANPSAYPDISLRYAKEALNVE